MAKRARTGDQLTGGSRDVNPQFLSAPTLAQSAADTTTSVEVPLPISRIANSTRTTVVELLKVFVQLSRLPAIAAVGESLDTETMALSTVNRTTTNAVLNDSSTICMVDLSQRGAFTAGGTYGNTMASTIITVDLTDGAGHGVLIGTDSVFLQLQSSGTGAANSALVKLFYRFKTIGMFEWIGMVQSQS